MRRSTRVIPTATQVPPTATVAEDTPTPEDTAVAAVATVLGLRHATDPDHLAAVTTLIAGTEERATKAAARLGAAWGAIFGAVAHAATRGQRDFSSVRTLAASHYDLIARDGTVDQAKNMLRQAGLLPDTV